MNIKDDRRSRWIGMALLSFTLALGIASAAIADNGKGNNGNGKGNGGDCNVPEPMWFDLLSAGLLPLGFVLGRKTWIAQE